MANSTADAINSGSFQAETSCFHCQLPLPEKGTIQATIKGLDHLFCCNGCKAVCETIFQAGLEGFYKRTPENGVLAPPPELPGDIAVYDLDAVQEEYVHELGAQREIHLLVEGIHCAACVWLIEHTLRRVPGVTKAAVNLSGKRLFVEWDNSRLQLSKIIQKLGQIGYSAIPFDPEAAEGVLQRQNRDLLYRMAFAGFAMMNLLWVSVALYSGADKGEFREMFHWIGLAIATPTLFYSGIPFFKGAWRGLRNLHLDMDLPIAIGATITYLYSLYVTVSDVTVGEVYYDTVVNFIFVILVGRYLEAISKKQAVASTQRLLDLQPRVATVLRDGKETIVAVRSVKPDETVLVKPGDKIAVDGVILEGLSSVDEAMLTGEFEPVAKAQGDHVSAGTINGHGMLKLRVEAVLKDTALGRIIHLVEEAQASKAPIQRIADRIVPWFVLVTLSLATLTFMLWLDSGFELALMAATSVLIITCPCAFGMATPMSIAVATGLGARNGILVKNGAVLETLSSIDHFVFDKTGTLTEGRMSLSAIYMKSACWVPAAKSEDGMPAEVQALFEYIAAAEQYSEHPIAEAILNYASSCRPVINLKEARNFINRPGFGIKAEVDGKWVLVGTSAWLDQHQVQRNGQFEQQVQALDKRGVGSLRCAIDGQEVAVIGVEDQIRADAPELVEALKRDAIKLTLLTGDRRQTAETIAERLGGMEVVAEVLPEDKDRTIADLQQQGGRVAMVGDGVNDAPALVRADVGISLGSGTDVSIASSDIVLMSNELAKVRLAAALSRRTLRTIRQNIAISVIYNIIMVPMAMSAMITPLVAAIAMPISSLLVIGNAARIRTLFK
ncbi:MAG: heavy metal translocating P-type ATPase [Candidatus Polarisedimenticolaceae bacterium]|nr:heavy metal translocating P-type ATPase [Candidatus Polarisedimenticolaceae bacterium]